MPSAEDLYDQALDHLAAGEPDRAIELLRAALQHDPAFLDALHGLIRAYMDAGQLDQGLIAAHELAERAPEDVLAQTSLSILYQRKGMIPEAEAAATRAKLLGWKQQLRENRAARAADFP